MTINDGGDVGMYVPFWWSQNASEIELYRIAEQSSVSDPANSGIFQTGFYGAGSQIHLDGCANPGAGVVDMFAEWRNAGSGQAFNCRIIGGVPPANAKCGADVFYQTNFKWEYIDNCSNVGGPLIWDSLTMNWGKGYNYVGGELNNAQGTLADGSQISAAYNGTDEPWKVWTVANLQGGQLPTHWYCEVPSAGWPMDAPNTTVWAGVGWAISHNPGTHGTCG